MFKRIKQLWDEADSSPEVIAAKARRAIAEDRLKRVENFNECARVLVEIVRQNDGMPKYMALAQASQQLNADMPKMHRVVAYARDRGLIRTNPIDLTISLGVRAWTV